MRAFVRFHIGNRNNTGRLSHSPTYRLALAPVKFLRKLDPAQLTVQALVNGASQTSRCLSFPFCSPLFPIKQCVEWVSEGGKSYISANCQFFFLFFFFIPAPALLLFWNLCVCMAAALSPQLGMPKMEACVYLSCNMRSSGCTEPENSISPPISTKDSRSPPPHPQPLLNAQTWRDGGGGEINALFHVMGANVSLFMAVSVWYLSADGREQWGLHYIDHKAETECVLFHATQPQGFHWIHCSSKNQTKLYTFRFHFDIWWVNCV